MKRLLFFLLSAAAVLIFLYSCAIFDYFSGYAGKNLISHTTLSTWSTSHDAPYMGYESVSAAIAGTTGLPDSSAQIYRIENKNLFPDGDFEASTAGVAPGSAGWSITAGTYLVRAETFPHPLNGNALYFDLDANEYISFDLNQLLDSAAIYNSYVIRFSISGSSTSDMTFVIEDASTTNITTYSSSIPAANTAYSFPEDFSTIPQTEFIIHSDDTEFFRINSSTSTLLPEGYIDNIRVVKSDQKQSLSVLLPFTDEDRIDSLELVSGWYRFSIYVKADPGAGTSNRFDSSAVTLTIEAIDDDNLAGSSYSESFRAEDYSSFSTWTQVYIDANLQIDEPAAADGNVIRLTFCPSCSLGAALGFDAGSILISNPSLQYSSTGNF